MIQVTRVTGGMPAQCAPLAGAELWEAVVLRMGLALTDALS